MLPENIVWEVLGLKHELLHFIIHISVDKTIIFVQDKTHVVAKSPLVAKLF